MEFSSIKKWQRIKKLVAAQSFKLLLDIYSDFFQAFGLSTLALGLSEASKVAPSILKAGTPER